MQGNSSIATPVQFANLAVKKGWLHKLSSNTLVKNWLYRYFTLENCMLIYFESEEDTKQRGIFDFNQISVNTIDCTQHKFEIRMSFIGCSYLLRLRASSTEELSDWILALNLNASCSLGMRQELTAVSQKSKFWRYQRISDYHLRRNANTGDLLLFCSKGVLAKVQRGITRGIFDHIAMIMCFASGKIILLEATEKDGVSCLEWEYFMKMDWHLMYTKIVYMSLETIRSDVMIRNLEKFVRKVDGKKFGINPKKLIGKSSDTEPGTEETFFCSELVASAYKAMGLLPPTLKSSSIWPADFINEKKLPLINSRFGQEMLLDFDL